VHRVEEAVVRVDRDEGGIDHVGRDAGRRQPPRLEVEVEEVDTLALALGVGADVDPHLFALPPATRAGSRGCRSFATRGENRAPPARSQQSARQPRQSACRYLTTIHFATLLSPGSSAAG